MEILTSLADLKKALPTPERRQRPLALVPTMGALHDGHRALVRKALEEGGEVVASVFVNPLQFGPQEDFDRYPRTREEDIRLLEATGASWAFFPDAAELVGDSSGFTISHPVAGLYCGAHRPGHFSGVLFIVSKLFHLTRPDRAYFGKKDRQQLFLIDRMVREFAFPVDVRGVDTIREEDGLAMSSRNRYLDPEERQHAPELYRLLTIARERYAPRNHADRLDLASLLVGDMKERGFRPEYVVFVHPETFLPLSAEDPPETPAILITAAWLGKTRLIDNIDIPAFHG
ncbi:pantoate--beta-alanine ligase [Leptospirillum ferriphilum]|jgi:pantoate--beta-alanine ligase|uniref:pantoate--beta-alanine ligase n=1 Tax=Leptospirillum ferriphilum TaxID=178606 RepID=UPI0006B22F2F|nr:pantoate--beta-alanine ligase [Leptospirillum ferriphilum]